MSKPVTIRLRLQTPVSVLTGEQIGHGTDYVFRNNKVCLLNHQAIQTRLESMDDEQTLDDYIGIIRKIVSYRKPHQRNRRKQQALEPHEELLEFLENELMLDESDYFLRELDYEGEDEPTVQLKTVVKNGGQPFIPGSTLKGAIKNAMAYQYLKSDPEGKRLFRQIINDLSRDIKPMKAMAALEEQVGTWAISISDSSLFEADDLLVYQSKLFKPANQSLSIPELREGIKNPKEAVFRMDLSACPGWDTGKVVDALYGYADDNLEEDSDSLDGACNEAREKEGVAEGLSDFYQEMKTTLTGLSKEGGTLIRLGRGKSYFHNSIGLLVKQQNRKLFEQWRKRFGIFRKPMDVHNEFFPKRRAVNTEYYEPLGWATLKVADP